MRRLSLPSPGVNALLFALAVALATAIASYRSWAGYNRHVEQLQITQDTVRDTTALLSALKDAETGQRGFLLTGEERYLDPYRRAVAETPAMLGSLHGPAVRRLGPLVKQKLDELDETVQLRRSNRLGAALEIVRTDRGKILMDQIRAICAEMTDAADAGLARSTAESRQSANQLGLIATLGGIALFALLTLATITIQRGIRRQGELIRALQKSEAEVKASRDWFETTLGSIGDAVVATDAAGNVLLLNRVAEVLTGWSQADAAGVPLDRIFVIYNEDTGAIVENPVTKVLREGRIVGLANHTHLTSKDGREIPIDDSAAPISDAGGTILGVVLVFRDVTERRQAERELKQSADRVRALINASPIGVVAGDVHGRIREANDALLSITGYTREELISGTVSWDAMTPPEYRAGDLAAIAEAKLRGACTPYEKEYLRRDGSRVPVYAGFALIGEAREESVAFIIDITELKKAEQKARESHARFQRLVDSNVVGIVVADERHVIDANQVYLDMLGYSREDLKAGRVNWVSATAPEFRERDRSAVGQMREQGNCAAYEKEYVRGDGTRVPILIGAAVLSYEPELSWIAFVADLTRQKMLERDLQIVNQRLSESNEELQRFAYIVAHDLRAPLRTISGMTGLLVRRLEGKLDQEMEELARHIQGSAVQMGRLISDLLDYSRAAKAPEESSKPIDSAALFAWSVMNLQAHVVETGAQVTAGPLPMVLADEQLARVFQNLIDNGLKYRSDRTPEIRVEAQRSGDEWVFSVRDNGIGFEMEYADRIFGVFERLHGAGEYEGTGIGLAICKRLVERYGGRMWAESVVGVGSTFYFTLPAAEDQVRRGVGR